jgi:cyclase
MDHTAGNIAFKDMVKNVVAHENSLTNQKTTAVKQKAEDKQLYPDTTFTTTWSKKLGKEKIELHYFGAAHTNGDIAVHFTKANIVHLGDLLFNRRFPYIDKNAGANIKNWITVLQQVQSKFTDDTKFVFGHANEGYTVTGSKADLKAFENYLTQLLNFVTTEIQLGKTKEEIVKAKIIPGNTEWKGDGIERSLTAAYMEIAEGK